MTIRSSPSARTLVLLFAIVMVGVGTGAGTAARAQEFGRLQNLKERTNVAYFYFAPPGAATVQVQVWGTVPRPGVYEVPDSTSLNRLLTMAGGAALEPRPENRKRPKITVRVFRPTASGKSLLLEAPIEQILEGKQGFSQFRDDDILVVETVRQRSFTWRDLLSLGSTAVSIALLVVRVINLRN